MPERKPLRKLHRINLRSEIRKRSNNNHRTSLVSSSSTLTFDTTKAAIVYHANDDGVNQESK